MKIAHINQAKLHTQANQTSLPKHYVASLDRYLAFGNHPGGFIRAVLNNDLFDAIQRADAEGLKNLGVLCRLVFECLDGNAWGSRNQVDEWMEHQGYAGIVIRQAQTTSD